MLDHPFFMGNVLPKKDLSGFAQVFILKDQTRIFIYYDHKGLCYEINRVTPMGEEINDEQYFGQTERG